MEEEDKKLAEKLVAYNYLDESFDDFDNWSCNMNHRHDSSLNGPIFHEKIELSFQFWRREIYIH